MPTLEFKIDLKVPKDTLWKFYSQTACLRQITPPQTRVWLPEPLPPLAAGSKFILTVSQPPLYFPLSWETIIAHFDPPNSFVDIQGRGPFASWRHEHRFESLGIEQTRLIDVVTYEPPLGVLGRLADRLFIRREIERMFAYRHRRTRELLEGV